MHKVNCCFGRADSSQNDPEAKGIGSKRMYLSDETKRNQSQDYQQNGLMSCQMLRHLSNTHETIEKFPKKFQTANVHSVMGPVKGSGKSAVNRYSSSKTHKVHNIDSELSMMQELCEKLNCPQTSYQIEKLTAAQDQLMRLQHRDLFDQLFGTGVFCLCSTKPIPLDFEQKLESECIDIDEEDKMGEEEGGEAHCVCIGSEMEHLELMPENEWHGFFRGYEMLTERSHFSLDENKKCIEIGHTDTVAIMETYLRAGVRCFMIDLFKGNHHRNQVVVVRFRQSELNVAKELGFPITSTLFARLSPRLQYTGYLEMPCENDELLKDEQLTLTTDRSWAHHCSKRIIFVNARYLLPDVHPFDIILVGTYIQLMVNRVQNDYMRCTVVVGGTLRSRMPVLFNKRCQRFRISFCELADITFAKEVGLNVIVSDIVGTEAYFENLCVSLKLLHCDNLRVFARVVLNNVDDDADLVDDDGEESSMAWALKAYDGFLGYISTFPNGCGDDGNATSFDEQPTDRILFVNRRIRRLIEDAHRSHKPFIFDPTLLVNGNYVLDPEGYKLVLYHPDKYLISSHLPESATLFYMLANAIGQSMPEQELNKQMLYCDGSHTGSDSMALATAASSFEMDASCIFVLGHTGRMVTKIASFRPKATIYFVTSLKSAANFVSIHHNVVMLYFDCVLKDLSYRKTVYAQFLFGLSYALKLKTLKDGDHVLFVYNQKPGNLFLDKYVVYKFNAKTFVEELAKILF